MFYQDFPIAQGVLVIDLHLVMHGAQIQNAPGDSPHSPDPHTNPVIMIFPGDLPLPPDPK